MGSAIRVGMGEYKIARHPDVLQSYGLGSCVGLALYDSVTKLGGLAHIMLPDSNLSKAQENLGKFADTAIPLLLGEMEKAGSNRKNLIAKAAGGAQMFSFANASDVIRIGERNSDAVTLVLVKLGLRLVAMDFGGTYGRSIELRMDSGDLFVRAINRGEQIL